MLFLLPFYRLLHYQPIRLDPISQSACQFTRLGGDFRSDRLGQPVCWGFALNGGLQNGCLGLLEIKRQSTGK